jgi:hypothetical protein
MRHCAPKSVAGADVGRVERSCLAAEEALGEIVRVPKIEVADLRAFDTDNPEELAA